MIKTREVIKKAGDSNRRVMIEGVGRHGHTHGDTQARYTVYRVLKTPVYLQKSFNSGRRAVTRGVYSVKVARVLGQHTVKSTKYMGKWAANAAQGIKNQTVTAGGLILQLKRAGKIDKYLLQKRMSKVPAYILNNKPGALSIIDEEIKAFRGSDDLGMETVVRTKDAAYKARYIGHKVNSAVRYAKSAKNAANTAPKTSQTGRKATQAAKKAAQATQRAAAAAGRAVSGIAKILSNPVVLKGIAVVLIIVLVFGVVIGAAQAAAAVFANFNYPASDEALTDTYAYVTELDMDLDKEIKDVPEQPQWSYIDQFHFYTFTPRTDPVPIISYLSVKYEDFKLDEVKDEVKKIHQSMYQIKYHPWDQVIHHKHWTEVIHHLDINLVYTPFERYIEQHKADMFPKKDDYDIYLTYNKVGGTTLRAELSPPFKGKAVCVSNRYGWSLDPKTDDKVFHAGIDIPQPTGTPVNAATGGIVRCSGDTLIITNGDRKVTYQYCTPTVSNGATVTAGQVIATVGGSGEGSGPHLHFQYEKNGRTYNPIFFLDPEQFVVGTNGLVPGGSYSSDQFTAIIAEASKYIGWPYKFGGKTPQTSFDCSGFVCWVLSHAGIKDISTDAQGLYDNCVPITAQEARPGDLIFFTNTYNCPDTVSHVGFYVGNGMMLAAGDPIGYYSYETPYWQSHFYAFGRLAN